MIPEIESDIEVVKFTHDNREGKPSEFEFINNPSSYQMQFSK